MNDTEIRQGSTRGKSLLTIVDLCVVSLRKGAIFCWRYSWDLQGSAPRAEENLRFGMYEMALSTVLRITITQNYLFPGSGVE